MKPGNLKYLWLLVPVIAFVLIIFLQKRSPLNDKDRLSASMAMERIDPEFASYISSFTSGYISSNSNIIIKFSREFSGSKELNTPVKEKYFSFDPSIEGETVWKDAQTLEFRPKTRLPQGTLFKAVFHLDKLVEVEDKLEDFQFQFQTIEQSAQLTANDLKCYHSNDFSFYSLSGSIGTADFADAATLEKILSANLDGKEQKIKWVHDGAGTMHRFIVDSLQRVEKSGKLALTCNASDLGITYNAKQEFEVPAKNELVLLNVKVITESEPYVLINFSNPIDQSRSLQGLIDIGGMAELKYIVSNNQVFVYPGNTKTGSYILTVDAGVADTKGQKLNKSSDHSVVFSQVKPEVRFSGKGNILPSTNGLNLAFETVNLKAIDLKIVKIFENNVLQFLQSNKLDGENQLNQVGRMVIHKRINLGITNPAELSTWKRSFLDLSTLLKSEPGAIYRISMGFKRSYSSYPCLGNSDNEQFEMEEVKADDEDEEETNYFSYYNYYNYEYEEDYYDDDDYRWEDRDNPCKSTYYRRTERTVSRNILASDLGLTIKRGNDGSMLIAGTDLVTGKPMGNVTIELYDYQQQLIKSDISDGEGLLHMNPEKKGHFIVAKKDKQVAYMRLDEGATLPLSMFEVSGEAIKKGVKGFIYGERGVWRPGDSLFLNFILEDKLGNIPDNHPVIFELTNPQGQLYKRLISNKGVSGFYNFSTITDKNAPTGLWNALVKIGGIKFNKGVRIETIMPNRLKIETHIGDDKVIVASKDNTIKFHTNWLTGAMAKNLDVKMNVALSGMRTEFEKFKDFTFDDRVLRFDAQNISVFEGKVDEKGDAKIPLNISLEKNAPGFLRAAFNTQVFEPGGAFSVDHFSMVYSPYPYYTGIKLPQGEKHSGILYTGRDHFIELATVDAKGNAVSRPDLKFELFKMEWRWWWDQYSGELANYANDEYHRPIMTEHVASKNGLAKVKVNIAENRWGRYLIRVTDVQGGHSTSIVTYFDWSNWMERDGGGESKMMSNMLSFTTDRPSYKTGEEVTVIIPSPKNGRALLTVENGTKVLEAHWLETEKGRTTYKFKVTPQMAPNVYVHISIMQPHSRTNDLPIRLYGVVPVSIDDPDTHLSPVIQMASILEPEKNVSITVSEENKKEMAFTLAVVDEGLLDITRFKTPDPFSDFYAKEALGVKTWDVYEDVIGAYGAELERILSIGGDGGELGNDGAKANRFKPMVRFYGPFKLGRGDKKTINFKMPMYVGSVRTMVIAGNNGAYGFAEKTTKVKAPLMLLGTLPRVLSITEEVKLPVSVFGGDKNIGNTEVKIEVNGLIETVGGNRRTVSVGKDDEKLVLFDLKVKNRTGIAKVKITASGGGHTATYDMELDVRNPNPFVTTAQDFYAEPGKPLQINTKGDGVQGTNSAVLEISTFPAINLEDRLGYLIGYPHGCVEQTTSKAFAQLHLSDLMELGTLRKNEIDNNINYGIAELSQFQRSSGGLAYWKGSSDENLWGTTYAGHFLLLAEKKGYTLPQGLKKNWIKFQQNKSQAFDGYTEGRNGDENQAYRLYSLALANAPDLGAMNRLREYNRLSNLGHWLLALAYAQIGQLDEAEKLISKTTMEPANYRVNYYTYGSSERDLAIVLQLYCLMNKKSQAFLQLKKVAGFLGSSSWYSTQTTAFGLAAVADFVKKYGGPSAMQANCSINGKETSLAGNSAIVQLPVAYNKGDAASFKVENNGKGTLFVRFINKGKQPMGEEKEANENIAVNIVYKDMDGALLDPTEIVQGTNFMLSVTVRNLGLAGRIENLALSDYIPSGWEIHNARLEDNAAAMKNSPMTYQDIRDDRVLTYFDLALNESKTFNLMLNAAYEGKYYLPSVNVEAMYDNAIFARTKGSWIRVVKTAGGVSSK